MYSRMREEIRFHEIYVEIWKNVSYKMNHIANTNMQINQSDKLGE